MLDAASTHLELRKGLAKEDMARCSISKVACTSHRYRVRTGGALDADGAEGGPAKLARSEPGQLGIQGVAVWSEFAAWEQDQPDPRLTHEARTFRQSVARGARVFREKTFLITDFAGINSPIGFGTRCATRVSSVTT